jgi:hypothetical protein
MVAGGVAESSMILISRNYTIDTLVMARSADWLWTGDYVAQFNFWRAFRRDR